MIVIMEKMMMKEKSKNKILWLAIKKTIKPRHLILLIILLVGNSFAWFIYAKQVQSDVSVHVKSWKILLESSNNPISATYNINIDNMYPGMSNFSQSIEAYNKSEMAAEVTYTILNINIMGDEIKTKEGVLEDSGTLTGSELTSAELATKLGSDYPFKITFNITSTLIDAETGEAVFTIAVKWPYESRNDNLDTTWGNRAYDFKQNHPTSSSITMKIKISVVQHQ